MRPDQFPGDVLEHFDKPPITIEEHQRIMDAYDEAGRTLLELSLQDNVNEAVKRAAIEAHAVAERAALKVTKQIEELVSV